MTRRLSIGIDMDGVLADLLGSVLEAYNLDYGDTLEKCDILDWDVSKYVKPEAKGVFNTYYSKEGIYDNVDCIAGSYEVLEYLHSRYDIWVVTDPFTPELYVPKLNWLLRTYPFLDMRDIVMSGDKGVVGCDYMIDDGLLHLDRYTECNPGGVGIVYDAPYNRGVDCYERVYTWGDIYEYFRC